MHEDALLIAIDDAYACIEIGEYLLLFNMFNIIV